jgi:hypothetical protein
MRYLVKAFLALGVLRVEDIKMFWEPPFQSQHSDRTWLFFRENVQTAVTETAKCVQ